MMESDKEVRIAQRTERSDGGGGYRFNFYGRRGEEEEEEETEEQKEKKQEPPVEVHLSREAERLLEHTEEEGVTESEEKLEPKKRRSSFGTSSYFGIKKKGNRL
jgi:hypothetical protein